MNKYLPSKKFVIFTSIVFGLFLGFFVFNQIKASRQEFENTEGKILVDNGPTLNDLYEKDSDEDGLKDWEEVLWGTDPNKKITFDLPDAKWVETRREVLKSENTLSAAATEENQTDRFSKELLITLAALKAGGTADQTTIYNLTGQMATELFESDLPDQFQKENAKIENISKEEYLTAVLKLLDESEKELVGSELDVLNEVLNQRENPEKLKAIADGYRLLAKSVSDLGSPREIVNEHLNFINDIYKVSLAIDSLSKTQVDPLLGMIGLAQYQKYIDNLETDIKTLDDLLS